MSSIHRQCRRRGASPNCRIHLTRWAVTGLAVTVSVASCHGGPAHPGDGRPLLPVPVIYQLPACSPDGERIAFYKRAQHYGDPSGLAVVRADGAGERFLLGDADTPAWDPSGRRLAVSVRGRMGIYDVVDDSLKMLGISGDNWYPSWSPDGGSLVYACHGPIDSSGLWIALLGEQMELRRLTPPALVATAPAWSPLGDVVAFSGHEQTETNFAVWVISTDGTGLRRITDERKTFRPNWSPDGLKLVYRQWSGQKSHIEMVDVSGGNMMVLGGSEASNLSEGQTACWHPDGQTIIYNKVCLFRWTNGENRSITCED